MSTFVQLTTENSFRVRRCVHIYLGGNDAHCFVNTRTHKHTHGDRTCSFAVAFVWDVALRFPGPERALVEMLIVTMKQQRMHGLHTRRFGFG